jgi:hypothetical protein
MANSAPILQRMQSQPWFQKFQERLQQNPNMARPFSRAMALRQPSTPPTGE